MNMDRDCYYAFIGTNSVRGSRGIYTLRIDAASGAAEVVSTAWAYNTGSVALSRDGKNLYAVAEGMTFEGWADGGVTAYQVGQDGVLNRLNGQRSYGQRTCCAAVDGAKKNVYVCNFYDGTWSAYALTGEGALEPARLTVAPPEDSGWKALHCVEEIGDGYVGVISLAECALVIYRADSGARVTSYTFPCNPFPRYFAAVGEHIYAMMQSPDEIYVFRSHLEERGAVELVQTVRLLDEAHPAMAATSTIRVTPDGRLVLAANRPSNTITVFSRRSDGTLIRERVVDIPGDGPRDFHISGDGALVVTAMQHSDQVYVLKIDYENKTLLPLSGPIRVPSPAAVAVSGRCRE